MKGLLCAAVLSTLAIDVLAAGPRHRHKHQKKQDVDWNNPDLYTAVDWAAVFATKKGAPAAKPTPEAVATAVESVVAAVATEVASSGSSDDSTGFGGVSEPVANGNVDEYIGNVGVPYGSNIIKISDAKADDFEYTNNFVNKGSSEINVIIWNKSGPDGRANSGQFSTPALSFPLASGASQLVAFDTNSQVAFCESDGAKTQWGANDCTYGEADFADAANGGWSGYDVSSIQNSAGNNSPLSISSTAGETSSNLGNNYVSDAQPGGIGGNLAPGKVRLTTTFG